MGGGQYFSFWWLIVTANNIAIIAFQKSYTIRLVELTVYSENDYPILPTSGKETRVIVHILFSWCKTVERLNS